MKRLIIILSIILMGSVAYAQVPTQTPLTKEQIEARLQAVQVEKRYLELQVQEQSLKQALENLKKGESIKKEEKKK